MRYYSLDKKIDIFSYPARIEVEIVNFEKKHYCKEIKAYAYGYLDTNDVITDEEKKTYGLVTEEDRKSKFQKLSAEEYKQKKEEEAKELVSEIENQWKNYETAPEKLVELATFSANFTDYSLKNAILLKNQCPYGLYFASYKKWQELGKAKGKDYNVKAGEKGYKIWLPNFNTYVYVNGKKKGAKFLTREEQAKYKNGEYKTESVLVGYSVGYVFDISQTNVPIEDYPKFYTDFGVPSEAHRELYDYFVGYLQSKDTSVAIALIDNVALRGFFMQTTNSIVLSDKLDDTALLSTLLHESGHRFLHYDILKSENVSNTPSQKAYREVQADYFSMLIESKFGLKNSDTRLEHLKKNLEIAQMDKNFNLESCVEEVTKVYVNIINDVEEDVLNILAKYKTEEKQYYSVNYQYQGNISFSCNIVHAYSEEDVKAYYSKYDTVYISPYNVADFDEDKRKGKPIIELAKGGVEEAERDNSFIEMSF